MLRTIPTIQLLLFNMMIFHVSSIFAEVWIVPVPDWNRPPYAYKTDNGIIQGIDIAILDEIGRRANIDMEMVSYSFANRQTDFINGKLVIDCCIASEWRITSEDIAVQRFSDPLYTGVDVFLFRKGSLFSISDNHMELSDKVVAGMKGYTYINQEKYGSRIDFNSQSELLLAISSGQADVGILERHDAAYYARKLKLDIEFDSVQHAVEVRIRLHKSKAQYLDQINQIISELKSEEFINNIIKAEAKKASTL